MKDNKKKELIEEIIGQLKDHELPYKEGSWRNLPQVMAFQHIVLRIGNTGVLLRPCYCVLVWGIGG